MPSSTSRTLGSYTFELLGVLDHPTPGVEDDIDLTFALSVIDSNQAAQPHSFTVRINDDAPLAHVVTALSPVLDDDVFGGNANGSGDVGDETVVTGDAGTLFTAGSDGVRSVTLDSFGFGAVYVDGDGVSHVQAVAVADDYPQTAGSVTRKFVSADVDPVAELVIRADDSYSFTTYAPLSHGHRQRRRRRRPSTSPSASPSPTATATPPPARSPSGSTTTRRFRRVPSLLRRFWTTGANRVPPVNAGGGFDVSPNERTLSGGPGALFFRSAPTGSARARRDASELFVVFKDADGFTGGIRLVERLHG
ncbi:MAG: hypothetical protein KF849_05280 [Rhizobiaceae bacterium]|nr:hypothetical protein [Rhizobiaceae bacterium]